ncbi:MAG: hypothetical protein NVSMB24_38280 [Mucilaginibacter sp.]
MGKRILVIDDDEDILEIMNIVFQEEDFDVIVSNTAEAAEHLRVIRPDVILLDVHIGIYDGTEICTKIKKQQPFEKLPVILISGEKELARLAVDCGADSYIEKPFDLDHLMVHVREYL